MAEYIGVYLVEGELGQGGMGEVFLAWDERLDRPVAIKRVRHDAGLTDLQRDRFRREARLAARLSHPSIVQVHDLVTDAQGDAIVMEYVEGQTLRQYLSAALPSLAEALRLSREIAEGLAAAHAAGLVHRDLKSDNVIVTPAGHAKILDFGLARPVIPEPEDATLTREGFIVGTSYAMSPEQVSGGEIDGRSDLFSLGSLIYEMLTGRSPFRGHTSIDSLRRVAFEEPPPLFRVRPDLPPELSELVERLLAKDREARPRDAREVTASLEDLEARVRFTPPPPAGAGTGSEPTTDAMPLLPRHSGSAPGSLSSIDGRPAPWKRRGMAAAGALVVAAALLVAVSREREPPPPLRVAVLPPSVPAGDERLALAGAAVLYEIVKACGSFEGLRVIDPEQLGGADVKPVEAARITGADEVIVARLQPRHDGAAELRLSRVNGRDGTVEWSGSAITVPLGNPRLREDVVRISLQDAYPGHRLREGLRPQAVRNEDYLAYLRVWRRLQAGEVQLRPQLQELETIVRGSPQFLEAQLQGVRLALFLYDSTANPEFLARARAFVAGARAIDARDSRTPIAQFQVALAERREEDAAAILAHVRRLLPGDPEVLFLATRLAERQDRLAEAVAIQRQVVQLAPAWQHIGYLASLEARNGEVERARERLRALLEDNEDNSRVLSSVAEWELLYGDLGEAERIYGLLLRKSPERAFYTNLGMALFLRGDYRGAERAHRRALEFDPGHPVVKLNLADVLVELRRRPEATALYREVLAATEAAEAAGRGSPGVEMMKAQCLARLGRGPEAVTAAQSAVRRAPDSPDLHQEAALVYSLAGDLSNAAASARTALEKGVRPQWFDGSAFARLNADPQLRAYLAARSGRK